MQGGIIQSSDSTHSQLGCSEENRIAWLSLKLVPGLGNRSVLRLLENFGAPEAILAAKLKDLLATGAARENALQELAHKRFSCDPESEWKRLGELGFRLICLGDADYPSNLAEVPDPPAVLFSSGKLEPRDLVSIAVVGSRFASPAGLIFTEKLSADLARHGVTVVSGFAVGIDSAAHRGALKARGRTLGVLGCGLDRNYPAINADLRGEIFASGALISEFPLGTPPLPGNFPARNRIISGLALGVVVVEAAERSGSLITARFALEQGREVFAVPGMAQSMRSTGPHKLLKQGAKLAENVEDILEEIRPFLRSGSRKAEETPADESAQDIGSEAELVLRAVDRLPKHIDEIAHSIGMPVQRASAVLLSLELRGLVAQLPGKYFICK